MSTYPSTNSLSVSVRVYRALLLAYPKKFREHYETQLVQVFRDSFREAYHHHGMLGMIDLWLHTFVDLVFTALVEHFSERSQYMFSPKVALWGGLAGVVAGMCWIFAGLLPTGPGTLVLALVLGLGGLGSLYSQQAGQGGKLGLVGFSFGIIGTGLTIAVIWWGITSGTLDRMEKDPASVASWAFIFPLALVILGIGLTVLGLASWRLKTSNIWRGLPLGLGLVTIIQSITFWLVIYGSLSQGLVP